MPITVEEKVDSREVATGDNASAVLRYLIRGTASDTDAKNALADEAPDIYEGLVRTSREVSPVFVDINHSGTCIWDGAARYGLWQQPATGESEFSFDTGGGTQHITQSLETVNAYAPSGKTAPDNKQAIGWTPQGLEGVDITVPVYQFTETHYKDDADVTPSYKGDLFWLTGRVNDAAFKGFATGEVIFLGASGSKRSESDWAITYRFAASPNLADLTIGEITGIAKSGWDYLWIRYKDMDDEDAKAQVKVPMAVYVERVYRRGDFSGLAIGT